MRCARRGAAPACAVPTAVRSADRLLTLPCSEYAIYVIGKWRRLLGIGGGITQAPKRQGTRGLLAHPRFLASQSTRVHHAAPSPMAHVLPGMPYVYPWNAWSHQLPLDWRCLCGAQGAPQLADVGLECCLGILERARLILQPADGSLQGGLIHSRATFASAALSQACKLGPRNLDAVLELHQFFSLSAGGTRLGLLGLLP
mmetsp:Transcript_53781/g.138994  ORF Transcript_53781/g.138994 Transcript_53781/m.138994 type:complete len:200 (+) Transcript_53781:157-756(+)